MARNGGRAVLENVPHTLRGCMGTFSRGAPSGSAYRRSAQRQRRRPSRRPEVATTARVRRPTLATAGRRAGAEARQAPNATEGRRSGTTSSTALRVPEPPITRLVCPVPFRNPIQNMSQLRNCGPIRPRLPPSVGIACRPRSLAPVIHARLNVCRDRDYAPGPSTFC
jgi:hypothetical protein